jgi:iron complex outermembrane recepter protein
MTRCFLIFTMLLVSNVLIAHNQNVSKPDSIHSLQEVTLTYQANKHTPVTFQDISSTEIHSKSYGQEPSFLLTETPSITNYSDAGNGQGYTYLRMRGIDQTRINISFDGVPMNEPEDQGAYFSNYPDLINRISRMQIQRGVGSSKNGVASFGGSIQLFSPSVEDSARLSVSLGGGSFNTFKGAVDFQTGLKTGQATQAMLFRGVSDGYKYHSFNDSYSMYLANSRITERSMLKASLLAGMQGNGMAWLGVPAVDVAKDRRTNANSNERDRFIQWMMQLQHVWKMSEYSTLASSVYVTALLGGYDFDLNNYMGLPSTDEMYAYHFMSRLVGFFSNYSYSKGNFSWTTGVHGNLYEREHLFSDTTRSRAWIYRNTGYKREISAFTKVNYTMNRYSFFADVQYRATSFDYVGEVAFKRMVWHFVNPKVGLSMEVMPDAMLYYSIGGTGREPTRNDMFGGNDNLLADETGKPVLPITKAEFVVDQELGFRRESRRFPFSVNLYYMDFRNEIVLDGKFGPNGLALTNNVDRSFRTGVEWSLTYRLNRNVAFVNNSSYNYSRIKERQVVFQPILTPSLIVNQEVVYTANRFSAAVSGRCQGRSYMDFANTATLDSYVLVNGRFGYEFGGFQLGLFLNNITNASYFSNGYVDYDGSKKYFVQAPTNFFTTLKYTF